MMKNVSENIDRPDFGLSRSQRLSQSNLFKETFAGGRNFVGRLMVIWLRSGEGANLRLGVIASKRTFRRAVDRARAKRLLREAFRLNRYRLSGSVDLVVIGRWRLKTARRQDVERDFLNLAAKAGLLNAPED